jgi:hypothetical protein
MEMPLPLPDEPLVYRDRPELLQYTSSCRRVVEEKLGTLRGVVKDIVARMGGWIWLALDGHRGTRMSGGAQVDAAETNYWTVKEGRCSL